MAGLTLTVLGCDGSYPGPGGACSGYLVSDGTTHVWLDAGNGTLAALQQHVPLESLTGVVLTHEHPDHCADVEGLYVWARWGADRRRVPVLSPVGVRDGRYHPVEDLAPWFDWTVVADGSLTSIGGLTFRFSRTDHGPETLAVRVEGGGRVLGYSADSGPDWSLAALGPGLDVALCEATFLSDQEGSVPGHLSARQAGAMARSAGVGRLVLTHLWPTVSVEASASEGSAAFGSPVHVARPGDVVSV